MSFHFPRTSEPFLSCFLIICAVFHCSILIRSVNMPIPFYFSSYRPVYYNFHFTYLPNILLAILLNIIFSLLSHFLFLQNTLMQVLSPIYIFRLRVCPSLGFRNLFSNLSTTTCRRHSIRRIIYN